MITGQAVHAEDNGSITCSVSRSIPGSFQSYWYSASQQLVTELVNVGL